MSSASALRRAAAVALAALLAGCGVEADLWPSGKDRRPPAVAGTIGPAAEQVAPDFTRPDVFGTDHGLYAALQSAPGVVLYFNMWCPICDAHMTDLLSQARPAFPDVPIWIVDYVSGSVSQSRQSQLASGWDGAPFTFLVDPGAEIEGFYQASMAVVVVGKDHVVRYNGEYDWGRLQPILAALPR